MDNMEKKWKPNVNDIMEEKFCNYKEVKKHVSCEYHKWKQSWCFARNKINAFLNDFMINK